MLELRPFLALLALLVYALLFARRGVHSAAAPLCSVAAGGLLFVLCGCAGVLPLAGWLFYLGALAGLVWLLYRHGVKKQPLPKLGFGFWFFAGAAVLILFVLLARQPMYITWDEFSTWGTSAKLMKLNGELYTTAEIGWVWTATQPPFLMCLSYMVQFLGQGYAEWQHYAAIDFLLLAVIAAMMAPLEKKHWSMAVPVALLGFLTPYVFTVYTAPLKIASPWLDSLADVPMGFLFGGVLAVWFGGQGGRFARMVPVCLTLAALTFTKDFALGLALVASVLVFIDALFTPQKEGVPLKRRLLGSGGVLVAALVSVVGPFMLWAAHLAASAGVNRFELGGVRNAGMLEMFLLFFRDLFSSQKSEHFLLVVQGMPERFFTSFSTMLGPGAFAVLAILLLLLFAALDTKEKPLRRRTFLFMLFSVLGFLPYFLLVTITYIYVFRPEQAFESFERYLYPYYIGWFLAAVVLLCLSAKSARFKVEGRAVVIGLSLVLCARFVQVVPLEYSVVGFHPVEYEERRRFEERVDDFRQHLEPDGRTFIVATDDMGAKWFSYCYAFLPWQVDYSYGGGPFEIKETAPDGSRVITPVDVEDWEQHLMEEGCTTVFIDYADEAFREEYGSLFADNLDGYFGQQTNLYEVRVDEGEVTLVPLDVLF